MELLKSHDRKLEEWQNFLAGMRVAIVGGDDEIDWSEVGRCDVVVRINGHWMRQRGRCDILYFSCGDDLKLDMFDNRTLYETLNFAWVNASGCLFNAQQQLGMFAFVNDLLKKNNIRTLMYLLAPARAWEDFEQLRESGPRYRWARDLASQWQFMPLTGMAALYHIITCSAARSVYIDGMSFYAREDGSFPLTVGVHDMASQIRFLGEFSIMNEGRIELSKKLKKLLDK